MNQWICEDVGLVLNEIKERLDEKIKLYHQLGEEQNEKLDFTYYNIERGIEIAKKVVDEIAGNWTSDEPAQYVLDKLEEKYNG